MPYETESGVVHKKDDILEIQLMNQEDEKAALVVVDTYRAWRDFFAARYVEKREPLYVQGNAVVQTILDPAVLGHSEYGTVRSGREIAKYLAEIAPIGFLAWAQDVEGTALFQDRRNRHLALLAIRLLASG